MQCTIYRLTHLPTQKYYIGSTINYARRRAVHRSELKAGTHPNHILQQLYQASPSLDDFAFEVITLTTPAERMATENAYINRADPLCCNIRKTSKVTGGLGSTKDLVSISRKAYPERLLSCFISPDGHSHLIINVMAHAKDFGLNAQGFYSLQSGRATAYRGWTYAAL